MQKLIHILFLMFIFFSLASCSTWDPWKADQITAQAEADRIAAQSQQEALSQEQARQQAADLHFIQMQDEGRKQARKDAIEPVIRLGWQFFAVCAFLGGVVAIFFMARSTVQAYQEAAEGITKAIVQAAEIRSRLIYLDDGRQFPAIVNAHMIADVTTGAVTDTTQPNPGNPQAITGAIANRHVGIVAKETRRAKRDSADSVPLSQNPPIIEAKFADVREYYEMVTRNKKGGWDDE